MAKFCSNCGKEINENAVICVRCGVQVNNIVENTFADKKAKNSLIFGLISIVTCVVPIVGIIISILGIFNASKGLKSEKNKGMAICGIILSILFLIVSVIFTFLLIIMLITFLYYSFSVI